MYYDIEFPILTNIYVCKYNMYNRNIININALYIFFNNNIQYYNFMKDRFQRIAI